MTAIVALLVLGAIQAEGRGVWIDAESGAASACQIEAARWVCPMRVDGARGMLLIVEAGRVEVGAASGIDGVDRSPAAWGRIVHVVLGGAAEGDLHDIMVTAWVPERSRVRPQLGRFRAVRDESVHVLRLSSTVFWVSGPSGLDPDGFLSIDGPGIGSVRVFTSRLREDAPEVALPVSAPMAMALTGRVRTARGDDAASATVEVFQTLRADPDQRLDGDTPVVSRGASTTGTTGTTGTTATTDESGRFTIDRVADGPLLIAATSSSNGRGSTWVTNVGPPVVVELTPPTRARGRVVRRGLGVAGARVHFVPSAEAWAASADPAANLSDEVVTTADGRFELQLPEQSRGELQAVTADGLSARVPIVAPVAASAKGNREIEVGDIAIPDPRRIIVRLLEPPAPPACDIVAVGPMGGLGLQIVRASSPVNTYTLDVPEAGQWVLSADCSGTARSVVPMVATVPAGTDNVTIDVRFAR